MKYIKTFEKFDTLNEKQASRNSHSFWNVLKGAFKDAFSKKKSTGVFSSKGGYKSAEQQQFLDYAKYIEKNWSNIKLLKGDEFLQQPEKIVKNVEGESLSLIKFVDSRGEISLYDPITKNLWDEGGPRQKSQIGGVDFKINQNIAK